MATTVLKCHTFLDASELQMENDRWSLIFFYVRILTVLAWQNAFLTLCDS